MATTVGSHARVVAVRARSGGTSSAVHVVYVEDRHGGRYRFVLRRYVRRDWLAEEPDLAEREAEALRILETGAVPAPHLMAVDCTGEQAGAPAVLMTALPGRVDWAPADIDDWLDQLVKVLPVIHATRVPAWARVRPYRPYEIGKQLAPPPWSRHQAVWDRAIEVYQAAPPSGERVFIHRDFHPGNVLWARRRVRGIVDWANASLGAPEADVGHCRVNLADQFGLAVADRFLARYQALTGRYAYHPYWDIAVVVAPADAYGKPDPDLDAFLARAVAQL